MKLTSKLTFIGLSATLYAALALTSAARAGGGDGDSPYNMPRSFYGGGGENGGGNSGEQQQQATIGRSNESPRTPPTIEPGPTSPNVEKKKELNKKLTTIPVTVQPGASFATASVLDSHAATIDVSGAKLKTPNQASAVIGSTTSAANEALSLQVASGDAVVAKHLALGFRAQGSFALNPGNAVVKLRPAAATPTAFASVAVGTLGADGQFHPEATTVVTVQGSGLDLSALVAQWSTVESAQGKTIQVELAGQGVSPIATARFAAGVAKPTLFVSTQP